MNFARKGLYVLLVKIFEFTCSMGSVILVARALGPEGRGKYALMTLIPMLLTLIATLGITNANIYLVKQNNYGLNKYITNSILFSCASSVVIICIFFLLYKFLMYKLFHSLSYSETFIPMLIIPVSVLFFYLQNILLGVGAIGKFNLTNIVMNLSFFLFLLLIISNFKLSVWMAIYVWMLSSFFACIITFWLCIKESGKFRYSPSWPLAVESISYGIKGHVGTVLSGSRNRLELIIVGYFMNNSAVGLYSIALGMIDKFDLINRTISYLLFAEVSASNKIHGDKLTATVARNSFWLMLILLLPLIILSRPIILLLYGDEFLLSRYPFCILLVSTVFSVFALALGSLFQGRGKPQIYSIGCGIGLSVTVLLDIVLVPRIGLIGAAISNVLGTLSMCSFFMVRHLKHSENRIQDLFMFPQAEFKILRKYINNIFKGKVEEA